MVASKSGLALGAVIGLQESQNTGAAAGRTVRRKRGFASWARESVISVFAAREQLKELNVTGNGGITC